MGIYTIFAKLAWFSSNLTLLVVLLLNEVFESDLILFLSPNAMCDQKEGARHRFNNPTLVLLQANMFCNSDLIMLKGDSR